MKKQIKIIMAITAVSCMGLGIIKVGVPTNTPTTYNDYYNAEEIERIEYQESSKNEELKAYGIEPVTTHMEYITEDETIYEESNTEDLYFYDGQVLNSRIGTVEGPSGKETYYNLPMSGVISIMRNAGFSEEEYPYWVRDDGCKMLGDYIMVAADLSIRPRGSLVYTSLGMGIVCDTGDFIYSNPYQLDIAVNW